MKPYFAAYEARMPARVPAHSPRQAMLWQVLAGATIGLAVWYLHWRWTASLNPEAMVFSVAVAAAETLGLIGTLLFFYDIWREGDTPQAAPPETRAQAGLAGDGAIGVDLYLTTYDEEVEVVEPSIRAALALRVPPGTHLAIHLCDDGDRPEMAALAACHGIGYFRREGNRGYKAGNLRNALFRSGGDFVAICDADTRVLPSFLENTLGYFRDPKVAWVQTPHWFYDIPEGTSWESWLRRRLGPVGRRIAPALAPALRRVTGIQRLGTDPFRSDAMLFFDVIQRRRNRHGASFCCGAGSIHRREAVFSGALQHQAGAATGLRNRARPPLPARLGRMLKIAAMPWLRHARGPRPAPYQRAAAFLRGAEMQPFRYHVSEDILTSIHLHADKAAGWTSVYHPQVECRMLSPWSIDAWTTQRLKYAGGTFDIMLRENPVFRRGMDWRKKLHYAATFWSYLGTLWAPVLLLAPAVALAFGVAPVRAYTTDFFLHLLPMLVLNELAMLAACKGYNIHHGRSMAIASLPLQLKAVWAVVRGKRPRFPPTPKTPVISPSLRRVMPNVVLLALMGASLLWALLRHAQNDPDYGASMLVVNSFWLAWNMSALAQVVLAALWRPETADPQEPAPLQPALPT
ncbi:glycosyltransferase [Pseudoroseicyclus aestuarii]|uniref:Cellulose synthase (UDP-forming) n=1 Tax=Pseudoroseicyclus aestuarii TaxID=1795041 RepID=A0A318SX00_9RHOB|nr:glycosyltransferase [Pseudoroseicyclus aestuarii]PYE85993.1 cellulose synthase (UDP-forming) [Pseudoroseicyclus aestuarii]